MGIADYRTGGLRPVPIENFKMTYNHRVFTLFALIIFLVQARKQHYGYATSINYGISQRPITDISQLMPSQCQNQSVICEGSFCIPGLRRCVCDLRQPVQFGRFCLRQVDIETKCFVTNQCNHTIRDAVCIDTSSNTILDVETSRLKLEQWQQLHELRQASKSARQEGAAKQRRLTSGSSNLVEFKPMFLTDNGRQLDDASGRLTFSSRDDVILSSFRNSPYEINYYTPELLHQNHTRRKTNSSERTLDRAHLNSIGSSDPNDSNKDTQNDGSPTMSATDGATTSRSIASNMIQSIISAETTTAQATSAPTTVTTSTTMPTAQTITSDGSYDASSTTTTIAASNNEPTNIETLSQNSFTTTTTTTTIATTTSTIEPSRKKMLIVKTPNWPPGVCSCPLGYMFDSMLRKCLALSLADSHCQSDNDCKQIRLTHCSSETRKCECDEPLVWNQTELACQRPRPAAKTDIQATSPAREGFFENLVPPLLLAKILPDQTMLLMIFVILVIICTLVLLRLIVKCFSSSNSALISPKNSKKRKGGGDNVNNLMPPKSPYATLRKPEHKPNTPLASFTQAARGRILNYDFEQDNPMPDARNPQPQAAATYVAKKDDQQQHYHHHLHYGTVEQTGTVSPAASSGGVVVVGGGNGTGTLSRHKNAHKHKSGADANSSNHTSRTPDKAVDECLELNDNVSLGGQLESESKSESTSVMAIPGPPPSQVPPYMLASAMKGQGSAIAAAAAAVANRRMQMAHKKNLADTTTAAKVPNGTPVFL